MSALAGLRHFLRPLPPGWWRAPTLVLARWEARELVDRIDELSDRCKHLDAENDWLARRVLELEALTPWPRIPSVLASNN